MINHRNVFTKTFWKLLVTIYSKRINIVNKRLLFRAVHFQRIYNL